MKTPLLILGLALGAAGGFFAFRYSPAPKAPAVAEPSGDAAALKKALGEIEELKKRLRQLEDEKAKVATAEPKPAGAEKPAGEAAEAAPDMANLIKAARPFLKNWSEEMEPRRKEMAARMIDEQVKKMTELAKLTPEQAASFRTYLEGLDAQNQEKWKSMMESGDLNMAQLMEMRRDGMNSQKAMDDWAKANLTGDQAREFETGHLTERARQVTDSANNQLERLSGQLQLSETQKDQVFQILVRTDRNYDPSMKLEGVSTDASAPATQSRDEAIAAVLTPEQNEKYKAQNSRRQRMGGLFNMMGGNRGGFPGGGTR